MKRKPEEFLSGREKKREKMRKKVRRAGLRLAGVFILFAACALFLWPAPRAMAQEPGEYYYAQLNGQEQKLYDQISQQAGNLTDPYDPSGLTVSLDEAVASDTRTGDVLFAFFRDHPEYFWINVSRLAFERDAGSSDDAPSWHLSAMSGESYFYDGFTEGNLAQMRTDFESAVQDIVAAMPGDRILQIRYFNNWLSIHNTYNVNGMGANNFSRCAASGILSENDPQTGPVCYGYATAMKVLLDAAGIPNAFVEGTAYNDKNLPFGERHAWNYVEVNGAWYALDPTWDDPGISDRPATEEYFLVGENTQTITNKLPDGMTEDMRYFKGNHVAMSIGNYGFTYPALSADACPQRGSSDIQVTLPDGTAQTAADMDAALQTAAQYPGTVIRLWTSSITVNSTLTIPDQTTIDLNGQGGSRRDTAPIKGAANLAPIFQITSGTSVSIINSGELFSAIALSSGTYGSAIDNQGSLTLGGGVSVMGGTTSAISGNQADVEQYSILPSTGSTQTVCRVIAPQNAEARESFGEKDGATVQTLLDHAAAGNYVPDVKLSYWNGTAEVTPTDAAQPAISWGLAAAPDGAGINSSSSLESGRYTLQASADGTGTFYGYNVYRYVDVTVIPAAAPQHTFEVSAPVFDAVEYGYSQVSAREITVRNTGDEEMTVVSVGVEGLDGSSARSFTVESPAVPSAIQPGASSSAWTIRPVSGMGAGTHTEVIRVKARFVSSGEIIEETAKVSIEVRPLAVPAANMAISGGSGGTDDAFIYGDTVSVEFAFGSAAAPTRGVEAALYAAETQIGGPVAPDALGIYKFDVDTADKKLPIGASELVVRCTNPDPNFSYGEGRAAMTLQPRLVTAVLSGQAAKGYDGTAHLPPDASMTLGFGQSEVLGQDAAVLGLQAGSIQFISAEAGTTGVIASGLSLTGNDGGYYALASDSAIAQVAGISPTEPLVSFPELRLGAGNTLAGLTPANVTDAQGNIIPGTFLWFDDQALASPSDMTRILPPGFHTFWYRFTPASANYAEMTGSVEIQVDEAAVEPEPTPGLPSVPSSDLPSDPSSGAVQGPGETGAGSSPGSSSSLSGGAEKAPQTGASDSVALYAALLAAAVGAAGITLKRRRRL